MGQNWLPATPITSWSFALNWLENTMSPKRMGSFITSLQHIGSAQALSKAHCREKTGWGKTLHILWKQRFCFFHLAINLLWLCWITQKQDNLGNGNMKGMVGPEMEQKWPCKWPLKHSREACTGGSVSAAQWQHATQGTMVQLYISLWKGGRGPVCWLPARFSCFVPLFSVHLSNETTVIHFCVFWS